MEHCPVLFEEVLEGLEIRTDGCYLDGTFGRGGHARGILQRLGTRGHLLALDRDPQAGEAAREWAGDPRFRFVATPFSAMAKVAAEAGRAGGFNGVLLDLGVSSPQLDQAERGFSFMRDGPLDMRMDRSCGITAAEWLANAKESDMVRVIKELGEERFARRVAAAIVSERELSPIVTTKQLATLIEKAVPTRERDRHPATRSFQAIRIHINDELGELSRALTAALEILAPGGRLVVISFHSLEDRIVKRFMRDQARGEPIPKGVPVTGDRLNARLRAVGKRKVASEAEVAANPRARSAVLRIAELLG